MTFNDLPEIVFLYIDLALLVVAVSVISLVVFAVKEAINKMRESFNSDCTYSDPDKRIGHDGDEPEWKE